MNCYKGSGCYPSDVCGAYLTTSSSALRISIALKDTASPVVADIRRTTIYNGSTVETETLNGTSISGSLSLDGTVYTNSQESHSMRIRQQDPVTKLCPCARSIPSCLPAEPGAPSASSGASMTSAMRSPWDRSSFCSPRGIGRGGRGKRDFSRER